jgi:hypothetical protein
MWSDQYGERRRHDDEEYDTESLLKTLLPLSRQQRERGDKRTPTRWKDWRKNNETQNDERLTR